MIYERRGKHQSDRVPDECFGILDPETGAYDTVMEFWQVGYHPVSADGTIQEIKDLNGGEFGEAISTSGKTERMQRAIVRNKLLPKLVGVPSNASHAAISENAASAFTVLREAKSVQNFIHYPDVPKIIGSLLGDNYIVVEINK